MENPIKMDDLGVPLFLETPIWIKKKRCKVTQLSKKSPIGPIERTPKPEYLIARLQLAERGTLGFGPIQFLMEVI